MLPPKSEPQRKKALPEGELAAQTPERVYVIKYAAVSDIKPLTRFSLLRKR